MSSVKLVSVLLLLYDSDSVTTKEITGTIFCYGHFFGFEIWINQIKIKIELIKTKIMIFTIGFLINNLKYTFVSKSHPNKVVILFIAIDIYQNSCQSKTNSILI